jgi:hypothetical protein
MDLKHYSVFPKILRAGVETAVTIAPQGAHAAFTDEQYLVRFVPMNASIEPLPYDKYDCITVKSEGGALRFTHAFQGEQEHRIQVFRLPLGEDVRQDPWRAFRVYSLEPELYAMRPYRGDFHVHTCRSDGQEEPAIVVANYRKYGFDFLAVTDHHKWQPSQEAISAFKDAKTDLKVFSGEEIHAPGNHIHIVGFGGNFSVNELFKQNPDKYYQDVYDLIRENDMPDGINQFEYASCIWCFDRVREAGGMGIYCHPHWIPNAYHVPDAMSDALFARKPFDAFELIGGHEVYSNNIQTAYYNEARAGGMKIPVVGSSDSHGTEKEGGWFNLFWTIVFARDLKRDSVISSVKELRSVAVEQYPGEACRIYGPYRMVKFAQFLQYDYFPLQAELCFEEGCAMKDYALGDRGAAERLAAMHGRTAVLLERCYKG